MKLEWVEGRQVARVPSESISTTRMQNLGQVVDERGGITIPPWYVAGNLIGTVAGAYHGYKRGRKHPVWNAIGWSFLSGPFWPVAIPVMLAQGFGDPK